MIERPFTFTETLHLRQQLWALAGEAPEESLYAVVDCARARRAWPLLQSIPLARRCLYDGEVPEVLLAAAPHIVELRREKEYDMELLAHGWGDSWGIFVRSPADLNETRRHLRRFLKVKDPGGRQLLLRYYDPRVLRVFLPTCTAEELRVFFGPLSAFYLESPDGSEIVEFRHDDGRLLHRAEPI